MYSGQRYAEKFKFAICFKGIGSNSIHIIGMISCWRRNGVMVQWNEFG